MRNEAGTKKRTALTLFLCFGVILLASLFTIKASIDKVQDSASEKLNVSQKVPTEENSNAESKEQTKTVQVPVVDSRSSTENTKPAKYIIPAKGEIIKDFSMDKLVYSKTLDQWMTHSGVDIAAGNEDKVSSIADGTVMFAGKDDTSGYTVKIDHGEGLVSIYSNLKSTAKVERGDTVKQNQFIGKPGSSSLYEGSEPVHLHFEMVKESITVDPHKFINFK